jgi:hypothetical protein
MNVKRGMDRISLLLAIIAILPAFAGGWWLYQGAKTNAEKITLTDEFCAAGRTPTIEEVAKIPDFWNLPVNKQIGVLGELDQRFKEMPEKEKHEVLAKLIPSESLPEKVEKAVRGALSERPAIPCELVLKTGTYERPPKWQCAAAGAAGSAFAFLFLLLSLRALTRLFLWILEGFR